MNDIVEWLRATSNDYNCYTYRFNEAADEIEKLRKENAQIRKFSLDNACEAEECWDYTDELKDEIKRLREALTYIQKYSADKSIKLVAKGVLRER